MKYIAGLDGVRAIAVLVVMAFHARVPGFNGGFFGVDIFFVLSGFLITWILHAELRETKRISLRRFYARRLLRLTPALFLCISLYLLLAPIFFQEYKLHLRDAALAAVYVANYSRAFWGIPEMLQHTWSLAVEEHFYLLWPLFLISVKRLSPQVLIFLMLGLYVIATAWRTIELMELGWSNAYYRFDTRLSGLVAGGCLAILVRMECLKSVSRFSSNTALLALVVAVALGQRGSSPWLTMGIVIVEISSVIIIVSLVTKPQRYKWLQTPSITYFGKISYGLYLFHYPVMYYLRDKYGWEIAITAGSTIAFLCAAISYHTIEKWAKSARTKLAMNKA